MLNKGDTILITKFANGFKVEPVGMHNMFIPNDSIFVFQELGLSISSRDGQDKSKETLLGFLEEHFFEKEKTNA